ncbi:MAG: cyclic nucleotide-binding domain-containing protein [Planctomycetales bacterium]|nr:cyclic nucleotide-binding domain-containing protein [Planctomycetales bacterium]
MSEDFLPLDLLAKLPIFEGMSDAERQQLIDIASTAEYAPDAIVLEQGKCGQNLLVLLEGSCRVVKKTDDHLQVTLAEMTPFEVFGEMSFFSSAPHSASVQALTPLRVLKIERRDYDLLIQENNLAAYKMAYNMIDNVAGRVRRMDEWVSRLMADGTQEDRRVSEWSNFRDKLFVDWKI